MSASVVGALVITLSTAWLVLGPMAMLDLPEKLDSRGMALFVLAGLSAPGVARWAAAHGVNRLGPSIAVPIAQGTRPLLAVSAAILLLGEPLRTHRAIGLVVIVAAGWQLTRRPVDGTEEPCMPPRRLEKFFRMSVAFPLVAGLAYAVQDVFIKKALEYMTYPAFGALIGMGCALLAWGIAITLSRRLRDDVRFGAHKGWLFASGFLSALALISLFNALDRGDVTLVSPIFATQPLAVLLMSQIFLKGIERLHLSTALAGSAIVLGTVIVSL